MSKNAKKIKVLQDRIQALESEMKLALQKKSSAKTAYDVPGTVRKIADLRKDIAYLQ